MTYLLILIAILAVAACLVVYVSRRTPDDEAAHQPCTDGNAACGSCSTSYGSDECLSQKALRQAVEAPVYFDDEELDSFRGRDSESYSDAEIEQFADVLYTMRPDEVATWIASLGLRGINLPASLRSEAAMLMEQE